MKPGDEITCKGSRGYNFTTGKKYRVLNYEPKCFDKNTVCGFTWPAYVTVQDDTGKTVICHANRFEEYKD